MYLFFGIFFLVLVFFFCINHWRRKKIIKKVCCMCAAEKCELLNELVGPFGYCYDAGQDIFTTHMNAWQRDFGYSAVYDRTAYQIHLIFDCLPVYFDYNQRTWLIEVWKGQYGMTTGGEVGIYHAGRLLDEADCSRTLFQSAANDELPKVSFCLYRKGIQISSMCCRHWWLTAFTLGCFSHPADLYMNVSITFANTGMARAFAEGLMRAGYCSQDVSLCCCTVSFAFSGTCRIRGFFKRIRVKFAQFMNRFWCRLYLIITRPFCLSMDRVLYLYYYLPFAFRRSLCIRKHQKYKPVRR